MDKAVLPRFGLPLLLLASLRSPLASPNGNGPGLSALDPSSSSGGSPEHEHQDLGTAVRIAPPDLPLAQVYEPGLDLAQYLVSEKFDGVRVFWDGRRLITRGGLIINAPAWFTAGFPNQPLDGELWMGRGRFARVSGTVRTLEPDTEDWQHVRYVLFDLPRASGGFEERFETLQRLIDNTSSTRLMLADQHPITSQSGLEARLEQIVAAGGEGLMLHRRDAPYQAGRSAHLLKVKPYLEGEAIVLEHLPGQGKYEGMLGSMLVEEPDGTRFKLGSGVTIPRQSRGL